MMQNSNRLMCRAGTVATILMAWSFGAATSVVSTMATAGVGEETLDSQPSAESAQVAKAPRPKLKIDRSGQKRTGTASFYANHYSGRTMADGTPMRLYSDNAASITLPLGTTARVTNLETGRSAIVTIRDRGPYVAGRIVDLSPATARKIGLERRQGLAKVEVVPLTVPLADGTVKVMPDAVAMASG